MRGYQMERQTYSVEQFGRIIGVSRNSAYQAVERGDVRSVRIGKRILIPRKEIERLLEPMEAPEARNSQVGGAAA